MAYLQVVQLLRQAREKQSIGSLPNEVPMEKLEEGSSAAGPALAMRGGIRRV